MNGRMCGSSGDTDLPYNPPKDRMSREELNKLCDCRKPAVYEYKTVEGYRCWRCNFCGRSEFFNKDEERKVQESLAKEEEL